MFSPLLTPFHSDHVKQADQSWGAPTGNSELHDEQAGEAIAKAEEKEEGAAGGWDSGGAGTGNGWDDGGAAPLPDDADGTAPPNGAAPSSVDPTSAVKEPEADQADNSKSYADYMAEQAEKKLKLGAPELKARKPNEGTQAKKEWENAKPISKEVEEGNFMSGLGKGEKAKRERAKKEKQTLDVDLRYVEPSRGSGERGGRGRGRGDRGEFRGRGRGRGDGSRSRGAGGFRGGRGGGGPRESGQVNVEDQSAFPSLRRGGS